MRGLPLPLAAAACLAAAMTVHAQGWKPEKNVEIVVGSSAGTGTDRVARLIDKIWRESKVMDVPTTVVNRPGGGGGVSWAYLNQRAGDPHYFLITSYNIVTNHINGSSKLTYTDFTLLSLLASEYVAYSVSADSPIKTVAELVNTFRKDPDAIPVGVSSAAGGANHIALGRLMRAAGVDMAKVKVVVFSGSNAALAGLLGGHVGLFVNSVSATVGPLANGQIRPLAVASPERLGGAFAAIPTLRESGIPVIAENWRLAIAPRGITEAQAAYWEGALKRLTESREWDAELEKNYIPNRPRFRAETQRYVAEQYGEIKTILTDIGLARAPAK
jgi:putative tricarboxylic transport membrane protein